LVSATTSKQDALVTNLPGLTWTPNFQQYAGYVTVDQAHGRNLFYWFVQSQSSPSTDPVVLWINGGPGCSTIGAGFLQEHGPFFTNLNPNMTVGLRSDFWSWNKAANMIYLDSPAGVGYSYSNTPSDYRTNDNQTAIDTTNFLAGFFQVYPEFAQNPFYISGESYAGVYIPTLAYNILTNSTYTQLKASLRRGGLLLGNPVTDCSGRNFQGSSDILELNDNVYNWYYHGMVSPTLFTQWNAAGCNQIQPTNPIKCNILYPQISSGTGGFDQPLRTLALDYPAEDHDDVIAKYKAAKLTPLPTSPKINPDCLYYSFCTGNSTLEFSEVTVPNCFGVDDQISAWLNYPNVQAALHARPTKWKACGGVTYTRNVGSLIPYLQQLFQLAPTMRVLYFSGDIDIATVPFPGTFRCLLTLNDTVVTPWRAWTTGNGLNEIAGYVEKYSQFTLATLKGAGHEAEAYEPSAGYTMFTHFLANQPFPR